MAQLTTEQIEVKMEMDMIWERLPRVTRENLSFLCFEYNRITLEGMRVIEKLVNGTTND